MGAPFNYQCHIIAKKRDYNDVVKISFLQKEWDPNLKKKKVNNKGD